MIRAHVPSAVRFAAALALAVAALAPSAGRACGPYSCGDPVASVIGVPDDEPGRGLVGIAAESQTNRFGEERMSESSLQLTGSWTGDRVRVLVRVPWVRRESVHGTHRDEAAGVGDAEVTAMLVLVRTGGPARGQSLRALSTLSLETGVRRDGVHEDIQPGNGAPGASVGLGWFGHRNADRVYLSALARRTWPSPAGYHTGDAWLLNAGWQRPIASRAALSLELNGQHARPDSWFAETRVRDTGGSLLFASPGITASIAEKTVLRGSVQVPIAASLRGNQRAGTVLQAAVYRSF